MRTVFKNKTLQKDFDSQGFVHVPVLDDAGIKILLELFQENSIEYSQPFHTSHFSTEVGYKRRVNETIIDVVFHKLAMLLHDYRPIFGNLMIKHGMNDNFMPLHADWTYVDETKCRSIAAWIALTDTDEVNGCLGVIEGSHKISDKVRGPRIQQTSYIHDKDWVKKYGRLIPVKAGDAIIFDHALMHYSPPNKTNISRPALNLSIVPQEADVFHYCIPEGSNEIEVYRVDDSDFYLNYNNNQRPETQSLISTQSADSVKWVDEKMGKFDPYRKKNILKRLTELLQK
jgi:hypothetical protein